MILNITRLADLADYMQHVRISYPDIDRTVDIQEQSLRLMGKMWPEQAPFGTHKAAEWLGLEVCVWQWLCIEKAVPAHLEAVKEHVPRGITQAWVDTMNPDLEFYGIRLQQFVTQWLFLKCPVDDTPTVSVRPTHWFLPPMIDDAQIVKGPRLRAQVLHESRPTLVAGQTRHLFIGVVILKPSDWMGKSQQDLATYLRQEIIHERCSITTKFAPVGITTQQHLAFRVILDFTDHLFNAGHGRN